MRNLGILQELTSIKSTDKPFISVYLNAEPNEQGRDNFNIFLKKQLSVHEGKFAEDSPERESYEKDVKKIKEYAQRVNPSADGVAIFSCAAEDYFKAYEFNVPFENNLFEIMDKPHIYPIARLIDQNPQFAVVLADSNSAKIYVMQRGQVLDSEEIENEKHNRPVMGGWSQIRFQRHVDEMRKKHAKEVVDELEKIVREEDIRQVVMAGNKDVVIPLLKEEASEFLRERIVGTVRLEIDASEDEIMNEATSAIKRNDSVKDLEKVEHLKDNDYSEGKGVTGVAETFQALSNGQVQELYITANFNELEYNEDELNKIIKSYSPAEDGETPSVRKPRQIVDDLITKALVSAERIRFIEDESLLEEFGGVGALLRFTMSADQN